ncbi:MAG: serine/threonine protein phosphatase [Oscillospiraceae bacterium]|nr:serine/threonine protein phosphatase [Oscillospiraceae bacterium]
MKKKVHTKTAQASQLRDTDAGAFGMLRQARALGNADEQMYAAMREAVPLLDAAVGKLVRLTGGFSVACTDMGAQIKLRHFLKTVNVGRGQYGMENFLSAYLDSLLTYGRAVGEIVTDEEGIAAICWGDVTKLHVLEGDSPLDFKLAIADGGQLRALPYPELLLFSTWNPGAEHPYGTSLFHAMPFLTEVLLKIYRTIGVNWERAGNIRYSVVYKPENGADASGAAEQMANEWSRAMRESRSGEVRDFVAVGDVEIKVIGADGQILDSEIPVRQILEQLVAKTGLPPFLLGLSWSSTERMSKLQADLLTSELWALRRSVQPVLERVCRTWLRMNGYGCGFEIVWEDISLQDTVEQAQADLYRMQAEKLRREMEEKA